MKRRWKLDFLTNATNLHRYDEALLGDVDFHVFNVSFDGSTRKASSSAGVALDMARYMKMLSNMPK